MFNGKIPDTLNDTQNILHMRCIVYREDEYTTLCGHVELYFLITLRVLDHLSYFLADIPLNHRLTSFLDKTRIIRVISRSDEYHYK